MRPKRAGTSLERGQIRSMDHRLGVASSGWVLGESHRIPIAFGVNFSPSRGFAYSSIALSGELLSVVAMVLS